MTRDFLQEQSLDRLREIARQQNVKCITRYRKSELIEIILNGGIVPNSAADKERAELLAAYLPPAENEGEAVIDASSSTAEAQAAAEAEEAAPKPKRGRPRKNPVPAEDEAEAPKRRGRPPKAKPEDEEPEAEEPGQAEEGAEPPAPAEEPPAFEPGAQTREPRGGYRAVPIPQQNYDPRRQQGQYQRGYQNRDYRQDQDYGRGGRYDRSQGYSGDYNNRYRNNDRRYYNDRNDRGDSRGDYRYQNRNDRDYQGRDYQPRDYGRDYQPRDYGYDDDARFAQRDAYYGPDYTGPNPAVTELIESGECSDCEGILEIVNDGYGFLRLNNYQSGPGDIYVSNAQIRRFRLKNGDLVTGKIRQNRETDKCPALLFISQVNGQDPEEMLQRRPFEDLVPIYPDERFTLESPDASGSESVAIRLVDLMCPIGKGQRGLIVSQPKAGKTTLLKNIANGISNNYPDVHLIVLLIDERPEEVTDMQRSIKGEVVYSTFDEQPDCHTKVAELVLERSMRLVEQGKDVVVLMDSITRLARAYNITINTGGKTLSGGMDPGALFKPKRFFGAARNIENGGSLTVIATALVETGSRMDDMVYEEFKGTGNMEIHLDRKLSERRIFPAVDIYKSGTRHDELLLTKEEMECATAVRRMLSTGNAAEIAEDVISMFVKSEDNTEFMNEVNRRLTRYESQGYSAGKRYDR